MRVSAAFAYNRVEMVILIVGALVAMFCAYAGSWSSRWARRFPGSGILGRASWGETFARFLPHTPSSNVLTTARARNRQPRGYPRTKDTSPCSLRVGLTVI